MSQSVTTTLTQLERAYGAVRGRRRWCGHPIVGARSLDEQISEIRAGTDETLAALIELAQAGDADALTVICHALAPLLVRWVVKGPVELLGEILQDHLSSLCHAVLDADVRDTRLATRLVKRANSRARRFRQHHLLSRDTPCLIIEQLAAKDPADTICDRAIACDAIDQLHTAARTGTVEGTLHPLGWNLLLASRIDGIQGDELAARYGVSRTAARAAISRTSRKLREQIVA